jgi:hypothetical protein
VILRYARQVIRAAPDISVIDLRQTLALRLRRLEELLKSGAPPDMTFVISEAVLMQQYGGPGVLKGQLVHVLNLADELGPKLDLRIQTFDVTPLGLQTASTLVILDFDSPHIPSVAYREAVMPIGVTDDASVVEVLTSPFERSLESSCDRATSLELISKRIRHLE